LPRLAKISDQFFNVVEVAESLFGTKRMKGKRGRGAYGKTTVFSIFERVGQVQRDSRFHIPFSPERNRMALQSSPF
jgi:hypothetical protein